MTGTSGSQSKLATVLRVTSANFLEMFDFFLFGFYASYIAKAFFPLDDDFASLMLTFMTFGAGFLMRPLGAIVLGGYVDRVGRRQGLIVTLSIMACGTVLIAFVPGYATIGLAAPALVLIGRLLQGFSAVSGLGGVSVYLSELATPGNALNQHLSPTSITDWGWRVPFFIGCMIIPAFFVIRRSLAETEVFLAKKHHPDFAEIVRDMLVNWRIVLAGTLLVVMTTVSFHLITVYTPTFGKNVLKLSAADSLIVTFAVGVSNLIWLPLWGAVSDRIGRDALLLGLTILTLLTAYPALAWLVAEPSFERMLAAELWLSFLYGSYNGAMVVTLTEVMPSDVRTAGFSLAYSLATALFGGFTPAISTALIELTGNKAAPGLWMSFAALCGLIATFMLLGKRQPAAAQSMPA